MCRCVLYVLIENQKKTLFKKKKIAKLHRAALQWVLSNTSAKSGEDWLNGSQEMQKNIQMIPSVVLIHILHRNKSLHRLNRNLNLQSTNKVTYFVDNMEAC